MVILRDVRVFDGERLRDPGSVVLDDGVLGDSSTPWRDGAQELDGGGAVLLPGLIDAHVHLLGPGDLAALAGWGITTALDMACWPPERVDSLRGRVPDIRSAGTPVVGAGGPHARMPGAPDHAVLRRPDQAAEFVARRVAEGSDYVKIVVEPPGPDLLDEDTVVALVRAARERGCRTVAHASAVEAFRLAVRAGVDVVTHVPLDAVVDDGTVAAMVEQRQVAVPTLTMVEAVARASGRPPAYANARDSVTRLHAAGVPVLAGTDANSAPGAPAAVPHGPSLHHELELLVGAGLAPVEALRAATVLPARHFGLSDRGEIGPGRRADLVLVDGDPAADVAATRRIVRIWAGGAPVEPLAV